MRFFDRSSRNDRHAGSIRIGEQHATALPPWRSCHLFVRLRSVKNRFAIKLARHSLASMLLLVALCTRALIPAGFMPGPHGLIVCPGDLPGSNAAHMMHHGMSAMDMSSMDMSSMPVDADRHSHHGTHSEHENSILCPFAAAAGTMAGVPGVALTLATSSDSEPVRFPLHSHIPRGTIVPSLLPRGPPSFS